MRLPPAKGHIYISIGSTAWARFGILRSRAVFHLLPSSKYPARASEYAHAIFFWPLILRQRVRFAAAGAADGVLVPGPQQKAILDLCPLSARPTRGGVFCAGSGEDVTHVVGAGGRA